ncbi:hypothetical protein Lupro_09460 [Lutibacter profundi]|uniref:UspA domain-containing protein n=1 Tax=Lutibacter profundi TaxID=1622118 RepID=A0A0X8G7J7_9FLAO|nr:universal stress protein [Lutibacter profundi]AMC11478.1 hypothetical protein Lupro_09460 [Lutibacter profundi]
MKNILILTDFSKKSWNSILYALSLFHAGNCKFYMLHAQNIHESNFEKASPQFLNNKKSKDLKNQFDILIDKIENTQLKGKHTFTPIESEKNILEATRFYVKEKKIDLIVIGTNGLCPNEKKQANSISEDIITKVKCSVLVVPMEARFKGLKEIAFPTDFTNFYEAKLLKNLTNLSNYSEALIRFLFLSKKEVTLNKEQQWNKETLHDYFKNQPHGFHVEVNQNFEVSIEKFINKMKIDLIIMAAKNLNLFEQILFRPKVTTISYYSKIPFLILH